MKLPVAPLSILYLLALSTRALVLQLVPSAELTGVTMLDYLNTCPNIFTMQHLHLLSQKALAAYGYNTYTAALHS